MGQLLLPIAVVCTVAARRFPSVFTVALALAVQALSLGCFFTAGKRFGWQRLAFARGAVTIGSTEAPIERNKVHQWTIVGGLARLYGSKQSYALRARAGSEPQFSAFLTKRFGPPTALRRRGSLRARMIALAAGVAGAIGIVSALSLGITWLAVISPLALIAGIATFGALSQRTTRGTGQGNAMDSHRRDAWPVAPTVGEPRHRAKPS